MAEFWTHFHWLRPAALWLLVPALLLAWRIHKATRRAEWQSFIDPHLIPYLLSYNENEGQGSKKQKLSLLWLPVSVLCILALAGPSWQRLAQPVEQKIDSLVIVIDLSLSMGSEDVTPSRIARARFKVRDLLNNRTEGLTALVVYAGDAHSVVPLTSDTKTIDALLPSLNPWLMPIKGNRPDLGIEKAVELLASGRGESAQAAGKILLITDELPPEHADAILPHLNRGGHQLSVLAIGTTNGAPIALPDGSFLKSGPDLVLPKLDYGSMQEAAQRMGAKLTKLSSTSRDLNILLSGMTAQQSTQALKDTHDQWVDAGYWLVWLSLPIALFFFRRGTVYGFVLMLMTSTVFTHSEHAQAGFWDNLWLRADQQGQRNFQAGEYDQAEQTFHSPEWSAAAAYRKGDYETAVKLNENAPTANEARRHYNQGNAKALSGDLKGAIEAYKAALASDPAYTDAKHNQEVVEKLLEQQSQQNNQQQNKQQQGDDQSDQQQQEQEQQEQQQQSQEKSDKNQQNQDQQNAQQDQSQDSDNAKSPNSAENEDQQPKDELKNNEENKPNQPEQSDDTSLAQQNESDSSPDEPDPMESEEYRRTLERVVDEPGGLLRRKFLLESRQRRREPQGEKIW